MSQTQGILRRPGEGPPPTPLTAKADAYFSGRLPAEEVDDLQDRLAHDSDLANEFLDWQRFSPPSPDLVPTATLAAWQGEDEARLRKSIAEEQEAREEAARLIGISVEDLGRIPPPPPPSYGAEEEERARRAIERLKPLTAAERLELVKKEPEEFGGEAVASACLVEARAALPESPEDSGSWARLAYVAVSARADSLPNLVIMLRADLYRGNLLRCQAELARSDEVLEAAVSAGVHKNVRDALFWAEAMSFTASIRRARRDLKFARLRSKVAIVLWEGLGNPRDLVRSMWLLATVFCDEGDFRSSLAILAAASDLSVSQCDSDFRFQLGHERIVCLARCQRFQEAFELLEDLRPDYPKYPSFEPRRLAVESWLLAALGHPERAQGCFFRARELFLERGRLHDAALVTLDWTVSLLSRNRVDEVIPLAVSMGKTFEALGIARETLASWAILREAAERKELTEAIVRRVQEEISRPGAFRQVAVGSPGGGGPLANSKSFDDDLKGAPAAPRTMNTAHRFPPVPGKGSTVDSRVEQSAEYFAGELGEDEADALREQIAHDPDLAETLLDWHRFTPPSPETLPLETLATWQTEDHARLHAAIAAEPATADPSALVTFPTTRPAMGPAPRTRLALKVLAATAGLAASFVSGLFITAPVATEFIVPASTLRGVDEPTTVILPRWPHKVRFHIDASTLGVIEEPRALLLDSMTDAVVATTSAEYRDDDLWASFWGVDPGNYRLEIEDHAAGRERPVANHPIELLASSAGP